MEKIVYVSGTFDMFHGNHLKMISYAKGLGGKLIVGVSTDELVASYKKEPIVPFEERIEIIKGLRDPDLVIPQRTLDHTDTVNKLNIDVFVIGDDWFPKYDYLKKLGVKVFYFPYGSGVSSSSLKLKVYEQYKKIRGEIDNHPIPQPELHKHTEN